MSQGLVDNVRSGAPLPSFIYRLPQRKLNTAWADRKGALNVR
jgi:hypothetical protein